MIVIPANNNELTSIQDRCDDNVVQKIIYAFLNQHAWAYHPFADGGARPRTLRLEKCLSDDKDYRFSNKGILFSNKEMDKAVKGLISAGYYMIRNTYNNYTAYFCAKSMDGLRACENQVTAVPHYAV